MVESRKHKQHLFLAVGAAVLLSGVFFVANLADPFLSDDWHHASIASHRTQPLWQYFFTNYEGTKSGGSYRPLVNVYWAAVLLFGPPSGVLTRVAAHSITLLFHVATVVGVFLLARQLRLSRYPMLAATVAAMFFTVFPNHAEAVIWSAAVSDPITAAAVCFSLLAYLQARQATGARRFWLLGGSLALWIVALGAKEHGVVLPGMLVLWELLAVRGARLGVMARALAIGMAWTIPFFAVLLGYVLVRYFSTGLLYGYYGTDIALDPLVAVRSALALPLSAFFSGELRTAVMDFLYHLVDRRREGLLLLGLAGGLLASLRVRRVIWWLVGGLGLTLLPVLRFGVNHVPGMMNDEGERYAYLPSVFVALVLACGVSAVHDRLQSPYRWAVGIATVLLLAYLGSALVQKNLVWYEVARATQQIHDSWPDTIGTAVVAVGLPDNDRGVPMWRNGFPQALAFGDRTPAELLIAPVRTALNGSIQFSVQENASSTFIYRSLPSAPVIVGPRAFQNSDLAVHLSRVWFSVFALSYRDFARQAELTFSPALRNPERAVPVDALFWQGRGWTRIPLATDDNAAAARYTTE